MCFYPSLSQTFQGRLREHRRRNGWRAQDVCWKHWKDGTRERIHEYSIKQVGIMYMIIFRLLQNICRDFHGLLREAWRKSGQGIRDDDLDYPLVGLMQWNWKGWIFPQGYCRISALSFTFMHRFIQQRCLHTGSCSGNEWKPLGTLDEPLQRMDRSPDPCGCLWMGLPGKTRQSHWTGLEGCGFHAYKEWNLRGTTDGSHDLSVRFDWGSAWIDPGIHEVYSTKIASFRSLPVHFGSSWQKTGFSRCLERSDAGVWTYHQVHTINNACFVLLGLLYGNRDYDRSICLQVEVVGIPTACCYSRFNPRDATGHIQAFRTNGQVLCMTPWNPWSNAFHTLPLWICRRLLKIAVR